MYKKKYYKKFASKTNKSKEEKTCGNCVYFKFKGLKWYCKHEESIIKKWDKKCPNWIDMFTKKGFSGQTHGSLICPEKHK